MLNVRVELRTSIAERSVGDDLAALLTRSFPMWATETYTTYGRGKGPQIDLWQPRSVLDAMEQQQRSRAAPRAKLAQQRGLSPLSDRLAESLEIRSPEGSMIVIVHGDQLAVRRQGDAWIWPNGVSLQLLRARIGGVPAAAVAKKFLESCIEWPALAIGEAYMSEEYDAYNMDFSTGARAIGIDISRWIRGLYWANAFGAPYIELVGSDRFLSRPPGVEVRRGSTGVLVQLAEKPTDWTTEEYQRTRRSMIDLIGKQYFFDRDDQLRVTQGIDVQRIMNA